LSFTLSSRHSPGDLVQKDTRWGADYVIQAYNDDWLKQPDPVELGLDPSTTLAGVRDPTSKRPA
jgi:hypothetical protein